MLIPLMVVRILDYARCRISWTINGMIGLLVPLLGLDL